MANQRTRESDEVMTNRWMRRLATATSRILRPGAAACALVLVVGAACGPIQGPPQVGADAPAFEAVTLEGNPVSLSDLRGEVVLLNLWATWCVPCRVETPFLQEVYEEHRDRGLRIVGVSVDETSALGAVRSFLAEMGVTYDILHDPGMKSMDTFHAIGLPATYLIDREGTVRFIRLGPVSEQDQQFWSALEESLG